MKAYFLNCKDSPATGLRVLVANFNRGVSQESLVSIEPDEFRAIPRSPFAYQVAATVRAAFREVSPLESGEWQARGGAMTLDDFRFLRASWEVDAAPTGWAPLAKGGRTFGYYNDIVLLLDWRADGARLRAFYAVRSADTTWGGFARNEEYYRRPGLTWSLRGDGLGFRVLPTGTIIGRKGPGIFHPEDSLERLMALCAMINSRAFLVLVRTQLARTELAQSYEVGLIQQTPVPPLRDGNAKALGQLASSAWSLKRSLDTINETSHAFHLPALLQVSGNTLADRATAWSSHVSGIEAELATIQSEIDDIAFRLYGIDGEDRARIEAESGTAAVAAADDAEDTTEDAEDAEEDEENATADTADTATLATELLAWAVGVAFGRFDIDYARGLREPPPEPGPFDPLPARSPGMRPGDDFAVEFLVDDDGHPNDLATRVANVFGHAFGPWHDDRLNEAVHLAGVADFRTFLRRQFFPFHLKRYSKSRRKAPIWWPLSTASGGYIVWLAWPRLTRDTLFRVVDEVKRQKVPFESRKLTSLKQDAGPNPSTREKSAIAAQEDFVSELNALLEEVERVAPLWNPVHDDGVILHFALLWRVVREAAWQKECRAAWEKLAKGDYDWAHIAMHLWPERVAPKCRTDRSLAIAHGVEDTFWVEVNGKWQARANTDAALAAAIAQRASPAVKAALRALESAPVPSRGGRGRRG